MDTDQMAPGNLLGRVGDREILKGIGEPLVPEFGSTKVRIEPFDRVEAGERRLLLAVVENRGSTTMASVHPSPVNLSYRWIDDEGVQVDGDRTPLGTPLLPGQARAYEIQVVSPE